MYSQQAVYARCILFGDIDAAGSCASIRCVLASAVVNHALPCCKRHCNLNDRVKLNSIRRCSCRLYPCLLLFPYLRCPFPLLNPSRPSRRALLSLLLALLPWLNVRILSWRSGPTLYLGLKDNWLISELAHDEYLYLREVWELRQLMLQGEEIARLIRNKFVEVY